MNLLSSLGLGEVSADPNAIPDNTYNGEVSKSEVVVVKKKDGTVQVSHVITYRVTEGDKKGAEKAEWFALGKDPVTADGAPCEKSKDLAAFTPSMSEAAKPWYKKRWVDLGVAEEQIGQVDFDVLVGRKVTFGVKTNAQGYQNINFVQTREASASEQAATPQALGTTPAPAPATDSSSILGSL